MQCVVKEKPQVQFEPVTSSAQQIGIMGGTFNPVHLAHLSMAEQVRKQLHLDEIWFIPNNTPPKKKIAGNIALKIGVQCLNWLHMIIHTFMLSFLK